MKLTDSKTIILELSKQQAQDLIFEMKYACNEVSVFPVMEEVLRLMEVGQ